MNKGTSINHVDGFLGHPHGLWMFPKVKVKNFLVKFGIFYQNIPMVGNKNCIPSGFGGNKNCTPSGFGGNKNCTPSGFVSIKNCTPSGFWSIINCTPTC